MCIPVLQLIEESLQCQRNTPHCIIILSRHLIHSLDRRQERGIRKSVFSFNNNGGIVYKKWILNSLRISVFLCHTDSHWVLSPVSLCTTNTYSFNYSASKQSLICTCKVCRLFNLLGPEPVKMLGLSFFWMHICFPRIYIEAGSAGILHP